MPLPRYVTPLAIGTFYYDPILSLVRMSSFRMSSQAKRGLDTTSPEPTDAGKIIHKYVSAIGVGKRNI